MRSNLPKCMSVTAFAMSAMISSAAVMFPTCRLSAIEIEIESMPSYGEPVILPDDLDQLAIQESQHNLPKTTQCTFPDAQSPSSLNDKSPPVTPPQTPPLTLCSPCEVLDDAFDPLRLARPQHLHDKSTILMTEKSNQGLLLGPSPKTLSDGTAGVYLLYDSSAEPCAIFKPNNEGSGCELNPKGNSFGMRTGVRPGECGVREVAAYLLDKDHFVGVPPTCLVQCRSRSFFGPAIMKEGSLQQFVPASSSATDFGFSKFSLLDVQKIAMFDIRIMNLDRHDGNLLVSGGGKSKAPLTLTPIDHGLSFPSKLESDEIEWCWLNWPQVQQPLHPLVKSQILSISVEDDIQTLEKFGIFLSDSSLFVMRIMATVLQVCVVANFTLFAIAKLVNERVEGMVARSRWRVIPKLVRARKVEVIVSEVNAEVVTCFTKILKAHCQVA